MPRPAQIGRKVRKAVVIEASLDADAVAAGFSDCTTLKQLVDTQERVADYIAFVRELDSGELSVYWTVDRAQKLIEREQRETREIIGEETIAAAEEGDAPKAHRRKTIARHVRLARRLRRAWLECRRWRTEYFDEQRDKEAEGV